MEGPMTVSISFPRRKPGEPIYRKVAGTEVSLPDFTLTYDAPDEPLVELDLIVDDGVPVVDEIRIVRRRGSASLTITALKTLPITALVDEAWQRMAMTVRPSPDGKVMIAEPVDLFGTSEQPVRVRRRRQTPMTDSFLREVARVYRDALEQPAPMQSTAERLHASYRTASRWVKLARDRGFIEEGE
jgi:hypothetical protein